MNEVFFMRFWISGESIISSEKRVIIQRQVKKCIVYSIHKNTKKKKLTKPVHKNYIFHLFNDISFTIHQSNASLTEMIFLQKSFVLKIDVIYSIEMSI